MYFLLLDFFLSKIFNFKYIKLIKFNSDSKKLNFKNLGKKPNHHLANKYKIKNNSNKLI